MAGTEQDGKKGQLKRRVLTDEQVIEARKLIVTVNCNALAARYGVSYKSMRAAVKGHSHKHLNAEHPPQA